ncbi:MAG: undecaprenyldiphospho-muramoylpentapeptide beta-N-acetylglucosaminyltransferase [Ruminococcus sp.]|jgi:UDP-N-acetylglucosamine--N-acetylmuramyl-(pentapeptide) pyrophosphoryl-undecaprenol N-acetylglucosamine transferase|nr:undecaprenyldiphospho-muramoylpentapeptide beta-N-acetylglucosaminyltransferase [Ruminococcus sp.]MBQ1904265.1 undecaprenyldiphospho-muramoylpentapeptide beta-N-acetylglucosaminyltransferase [Ruminococcus sp.]MBQ3936260.1 undecaprenyldiphospho-muramoylpentapeptide beta-N-acetylglucosaminyltransferase [Ruminococcus sp.]MBQ9869821.1 undecaprenyldiphospho-muramoylpentapeptide beta-N-acetylglucosaminyltransferase [Ruminococcus sp.]MCR5478813.1 undecaprenyldiphospho-muramoylpentapeptide beta-N-ac
MYRVLLAGGGTAGHVNPALAIAEIIKDKYPDTQFCFAGNPDKIEAELVKKAGYRFEPVRIEGFQRHINPANIKRNFKAVGYLMKSGRTCKKIIRDFKPDLVVGTGGYVSGPVVRAAAKMGIKTAVHEQNAFAGVTNKLLAKHVDLVMLSVKEAKKYFDKAKQVVVTGLPVRKAFSRMSKQEARKKLGFDDDTVCVLSTGGSLGSLTINRYVAKLLKYYQDNDIKVDHIHSYGTYADYKDYVKTLENDGVKVKDDPHRIVDSYINMPVAMAACDLVITRCGACALTEIEAMGRPAVMIPSPMVAENHQYYNGLVLQNAGAGIVIEEKDLTEEGFIKTVMDYINDRAKLEESAKNAAKLHITDTRERIMQALDKLLEK